MLFSLATNFISMCSAINLCSIPNTQIKITKTKFQEEDEVMF